MNNNNNNNSSSNDKIKKLIGDTNLIDSKT